MTDFEVHAADGAVAIQIMGVGQRRDELLRAFGECQDGRCSCPTDEYEKVAAMEVRPTDDRIDIHLEAKAGARLDPAEITTCVEHTVRAVG